jgi:hypothetical protein
MWKREARGVEKSRSSHQQAKRRNNAGALIMFRAEAAAEAEKEKRVLYNADIGDCISTTGRPTVPSVVFHVSH